jgi:hypothetical protein
MSWNTGLPLPSLGLERSIEAGYLSTGQRGWHSWTLSVPSPRAADVLHDDQVMLVTDTSPVAHPT